MFDVGFVEGFGGYDKSEMAVEVYCVALGINLYQGRTMLSCRFDTLLHNLCAEMLLAM